MTFKVIFLIVFALAITLNVKGQTVVINEIMATPPGGVPTNSLYDHLVYDPSQNQEWIELYNPDPCNPVDLSCYTLASNLTNEDPNWGAYTFPAGTVIPAGGYLVIGGNNCTVVDITLGSLAVGSGALCGANRWFLRDIHGWIGLFNPANTLVDAVYWSNDGAGGLATAPQLNATGRSSTCTCGADLNIPAASAVPGIEYAGASNTGLSFARVDNASLTWTDDGNPTPGACNSICVNPLVVSTSNTNEVCSDASGTASVSVSGGTLPYSFNWSNGGTTQSITNLASGVYTVTVTDNTASACSGQNTQIGTVTISNSGGVCCTNNFDGNPSSVDNTVCGVSPPCTYSGPSLIINEIRVNPGGASNDIGSIVGSSGAEFIEIYNPSPCPDDTLDISCYLIGGNNNWFRSNWTIRIPNGTKIPPLGFYTICGDAVNGCDFYFKNFVVAGNHDPNIINSGSNQPWLENAPDWKMIYDPSGNPIYGLAWANNNPFNTADINSDAKYNYTPPIVNRAGCPNVVSLASLKTVYNSTPGKIDYLPNSVGTVADFKRTTDGGAWFRDPVSTNITPNACNAACAAPWAGGGPCDGTATITPVNGSGNYSYAWDADAGLQTTATATGLCGGCYDVTVNDITSGCSFVSTVCVSDGGGPTITDVTVNVTCNGDNDGSINVTLNPLVGPYTYDWNDGTYSTEDISGLAPGTYSLYTLNTSTNCSATTLIEITEPSVLGGSLTGTNVTINGGSDGTVTAVGSGGTAPYTYVWSTVPPQLTSMATGLTAGCYTVTITDAHSCTFVNSICITEPPCSITVNPVNADPCAGMSNGAASVQLNDGIPTYTYSWAGGVAAGQTSNPAINLPQGSYSVTVTDGAGCTGTTIVTLTDLDPLLLTETSNVPDNCGNAIGEFEVVASDGWPEYEYSNNGGTSWTDNASYTGLAAATYTVNARDDRGCTATITVIIADVGSVTSGYTQSANQCLSGNSFNFTNTGTSGTGVTYSWTFASGTPSTSTSENPTGVTWASSGTYNISQTVNYGTCSDVENSTVTIFAHPTVTVNSPTVCSGATATLTATPNPAGTYTYTWSVPGGATNPGNVNTFGTTVAGTYTVMITDGNTCTGTNTGVVTLRTNPTVTVNSPSVCSGASATLTATPNPAGTYGYSWAVPLGATDPGDVNSFGTTIAGTYSVTVTDGNTCTGVNTGVVTLRTNPTVTVNNPTVCSGSTATLTATPNPAGTYTYEWGVPLGVSDPGDVNSFGTTVAGTYSVTVTDGNTCTGVNTGVVTVNANPTVSVNNPNVCSGLSATVIATPSPAGTYTYSWTVPGGATNPGNVNSFGTMIAGNYDVMITDGNTCTAINTGVVGVSTNPTVTVNSPSVCSGFTATLTATPNPIASYTYTWAVPIGATDPGNVGTFGTLVAGTYSVTITDGNTCTGSNTGLVTVNANPTVTVNSPTVCLGNSATLTATPNPAGAYDYSWAVPIGATSPGNVNTFGTTVTGTYTVTVTDGNTCTGSNTGVATINANPTVIVTKTDITCNGLCDGSVLATPSGGGGSYGYTWDNGAPSIQNPTGLCVGTFNVTVADANTCTVIGSASIAEPTAIVPSVSAVNDYCGQRIGTATASATGGTVVANNYTYRWSVNANSQTTATATGLSAATYTVTITDNNNCTATATATVNNVAGPTASTTTTNETCSSCNGTATAQVNGGTVAAGYDYIWSNNGQITQTAINLCAGNYTVTATDDMGCTVVVLATVVGIPGPIVNITKTDVTCYNLNNGSLTANATGTATLSYSWANSGGNVGNTSTISNLAAGIYTVTVTDGNSCTISANRQVNQPTELVLVQNQQNILCFGDCTGQLIVSASGGTPNYTYVWNGTPQNTATVTGLCTGAYSVVVTDNNGCTNSLLYTLNQPLDITYQTQTLREYCDMQNGKIEVVNIAGGTGNKSISWDLNGNNSPNALPGGTYSYTITDANGCTKTEQVLVSSMPAPTVNIVANPDFCNEGIGNATVTVTGGTGLPITYDWVNLGNNTSSISNLRAGDYELQINDSNCIVSTNFSIDNYGGVSADFYNTPTIIEINEPYCSFYDDSQERDNSQIVSWLWHFGDNYSSFEQNPVHEYSNIGIYQVELIVIDQYTCKDTVLKYVEVKNNFTFYIPNAFTPSSDSKNEFYGPKMTFVDTEGYEYRIFDRWGKQIFFTTDIEEHWNGRIDNTGNKIVPQGVYVWHIILKDMLGQEHTYIGHVTLIK